MKHMIKRSIMYFLAVLSDNNSVNFCKKFDGSRTKIIAHYIYGKKQGPSPSWPASLSRSDALDKIVANFTAIWEKYQPSDCDLKTLYSKPHLFFKWFNFLSKEVQKKVFIMEPQAAKVASKAYILRKLLEIPFAATLNRQKFSSLLEQILAAVNSDKPFLPGNNHRTSRHNRYP
ncbi:hypothetical protein BDF20DRAFT_711713 [Mycotypha africana]|uniref:uncharacterized protein n=1 Tax=Mycotypha africana TaxID=64632 RepID=UPI002300B54A|nr:uncharacterized protein BDF20DRAFT_711713 [Mycotypha africana]KAI8971964.1 hypothetical protein BDF20DRAFT_711713 [Mycotypha africana]